MGVAWSEIDRWLRDGGRVVAASERAARAVVTCYHRARQAEGRTAWPSPQIQDWNSFVQDAWRDAGNDPRLLLNPLQEQSIWERIIASDRREATVLEGSRQRLAALAMEAHALLCAYAPKQLNAAARSGWSGDAAAFSGWLAAFDGQCNSDKLLSPARLPLDLIAHFETASRAPLLLVGFDRILPAQHKLFDAWGSWQLASLDQSATQVHHHEAADAQHEMAACARWCGQQLASNPEARLLIITQNASTLRGQIERSFLKHASAAPPIEFSLGVPLRQVDLIRGAFLLLRWLTQPIAEHEIDWLFSTRQTAANPQETLALQSAMRTVRARGEQRPEWPLQAFLQHRIASQNLPAAWTSRITVARQILNERARTQQSPTDWAEFVPHLLERAGWPGGHPLTSPEYQAMQRWQHAVEICGSLGFDGRRIHWSVFLSALSNTLDATLFDLESRNAPILVTGPAESAGLTADAIWFLGVNEDSWPAAGSTHPFIPLAVQRELFMPHATAQLDWNLAHSITTRLLASAPEVHFSYTRQGDVADMRPSRLIVQFAGAALQLPQERALHNAQTVLVRDASRVPFTHSKVKGGSSVLTAQSQCPFRAFATARLGAQHWEPAEAGLNAMQRGQLLHATLHAVWSGQPEDLGSLSDLHKLVDKRAFVAARVDRVFRSQNFAHLGQHMSACYLALEQERLIRVVTEWLDYESMRADFSVAETESARNIHLAGLTFDVRLDRIDRLADNSLLVIDYKSGDIKPSVWNTPRPEDVQLPLYAEYAIDRKREDLGGLVFAKVRAGKPEFAGYLRDANTTLWSSLTAKKTLAKKPLNDEQRLAWRAEIEQLARDFLAGNAQVDPRTYPETCERCGLQSICRVEEPENQAWRSAQDEPETEEPSDG